MLPEMTTTYIQKPHLCPWGFAAAKERWKATIGGTIHDMMNHLKHIGVGDRQLKQKDNRQKCIYEFPQGQIGSFKFDVIYKHRKVHNTTAYHPARKLPCAKT